MKNIANTLFAGLLLLVFSTGVFAEDKYSQLAREITEAGASIHGKKIAIIPFSYADGRAGATKDGSVISERLTIKMINSHKFEIIERSVLDKVMDELKLQASGTIDASSAQQLGKVLGVEAIVTGTLVEMQGGKIEVNARLIKTETAQAIGASQVMLEKDWIGDAPTAPRQPAFEPPYQQPAPQPSSRARRGEFAYGFFDVFMGFGAPNMALEFANSNNNINMSELGITRYDSLGNPLSDAAVFRSVRWDKLVTDGLGPIAFRVGGFGNGPLGGDLELSFEKRNIKAQKAPWLINGASAGNFTFGSSDYATVKSFGISGDLLLRVPTKRADPYFGIGAGLSLNSVTMPSVKGLTNSTTYLSRPVEDFGAGFMLRIPVGLRIKTGANMHIVTELRYEMNYIMFDRGINGESDTITLSGVKFLVGLGFTF